MKGGSYGWFGVGIAFSWCNVGRFGRLVEVVLEHCGETLFDPGVCARCAASGPTCCQLTPGQEEMCFPVSETERVRIVDHLGPRRGGFRQERNSTAFLDNLVRLFPKEREAVCALFPSHGFHLRLSTNPDGECLFLTSAGCALPNEVRPYYCRLFPFWTVGGRLTAFASNGCLAHREGRAVPGMLDLLETTSKKMRDLHCRLRMAWGLPPKEGMPNVTAALAGFSK